MPTSNAIPSHWRLAVASAATALTVLIPRPGLAQADTKQVALTISGGVSLGSYEAGVNWALTHALSEPDTELVVVTGASAGNINTLLTAYSWCGIDPQSSTPEQSIFWKAWVPVDLSGLVPRGFGTDYKENEGLFTRAAFNEAISSLKGLSTTPAPRDCALRLGITLSKRKPGKVVMSAGSRNLEIPAMRYVVPFEATATKHKPLQFISPTRQQLKDWSIPELGPHLIPGPPGQEVRLDDQLLNYVLAASAFPYAFGAMELEYWDPDDTASAGSGSMSKRDVFLDGGVFDNVPVGLSLGLLKSNAPTKPPPRFIFYIDPDQRRDITRPAGATVEEEKPVPLAGVNAVLDFMDGAVSSARKHELQTVARYAQAETKPQAQLRLTSRTINVFGEYYAAFGAFTDARFRSMDFYLGLFDGLVFKAEWSCEQQPAGAERARCVVDQMDTLQKKLNLRVASPLAAYVVDRLLPFTYPEAKTRVGDALPARGADTLSPREAKVMLDVLIGKEHETFSGLLSALSEAGEEQDLEWNSPIIDDPGAYAAEYINRMLMRALTIEQLNEKRGNIRPLAIANLVARSVLPQRGFELDPSSIPDSRESYHTFGSRVGHALPYYLGFELMPKTGKFGVRAQWRPSLPLGSRLRLITPVDAGWLGQTQGGHVGVGLGLKLVLAPSLGFSVDASAGGTLWGHDLATAVREGPELLKVDSSLQGGVTIFESFHVGYTYYRGPKIHGISLGLMDFNGIAYWLSRTASGI